MARAVQVFKNNALEHNRLSAEREKAEKMAIRDTRAAQLKIADDFESRAPMAYPPNAGRAFGTVPASSPAR